MKGLCFMDNSTPSATVTASPAPSIKIVKPAAPVKAPRVVAVKPPVVEHFARYFDTNGNLLATTKRPRGAVPLIATKLDSGDWEFRGCTSELVNGELLITVPPTPEKPAPAKKEIFYITVDAMGVETARTLKGKGPTKSGWIKREDGNYVQASVPTPNTELPIGATVIPTGGEATQALSDRLSEARANA